MIGKQSHGTQSQFKLIFIDCIMKKISILKLFKICLESCLNNRGGGAYPFTETYHQSALEMPCIPILEGSKPGVVGFLI